MTSEQKRPAFVRARVEAVAESPEALFTSLNRRPTHGYLRGEQQEILRSYAEKGLAVPDLALGLPTGTGKTAVGLLIADWGRRKLSQPAVYLTLTNQLAHQVILEAGKLGIPVANLTGRRDSRTPAEVARFAQGFAVGVTHYSNLFNVNPVAVGAGIIVLDDAHGAEGYVADMWTVRLRRGKERELYDAAFAALGPALSDSQRNAVGASDGDRVIELCEVTGQAGVVASLRHLLDNIDEPARILFPWRNVRNNLHACIVLVSYETIAIRPLVPPTHTHPPFADAKQRIYMSATLGSTSDLQRAYGVRRLDELSVGHPQWGRRYIFVPGRWAGDDVAAKVVASIWDATATRAVILAPSQRLVDQAFDSLDSAVTRRPSRVIAAEIEESLEPFTTKSQAVLTLAGRYDGLDLPDDKCRLLLMHGSPAAVTELERYLSDQWKMGPLLRGRERTRLIQGLGRCTRNSTDFAIVIWTGESLVSATGNLALRSGLPSDLRAELDWGLEQSQLAEKGPEQLVDMALGLLDDAEYRADANAQIAELRADVEPIDLFPPNVGRLEVQFSAALWDEDYPQAYKVARDLLDQATATELVGYRAWWWYLASIAAFLDGRRDAELDCFRNGVSCGVNRGRLVQLQRRRPSSVGDEQGDVDASEWVGVEGVWDRLVSLGWNSLRFGKHLNETLALLGQTEHKQFHEGLGNVGSLLGAEVIRVSTPAAPDVVWSFGPGRFIAFEAKSEKLAGSELSSSDLREARGHRDWIAAKLAHVSDPAIVTVVLAPNPKVDATAAPFVGDLLYMSLDDIRQFGISVTEAIRDIRAECSGMEFGQARDTVLLVLRNNGLSAEQVISRFSAARLADR